MNKGEILDRLDSEIRAAIHRFLEDFGESVTSKDIDEYYGYGNTCQISEIFEEEKKYLEWLKERGG